MNSNELTALIGRLTDCANAADGAGFAACFTEDGVYHDYIYGPHRGREQIAHMLEGLFRRDSGPDYRWQFFDVICDGDVGYGWSLCKFTSTVPQFAGKHILMDGMSRFVLRDGLIAEYHESVNGSVAQAQLGVEPVRMAKIADRWAKWLREAPASVEFLARD